MKTKIQLIALLSLTSLLFALSGVTANTATGNPNENVLTLSCSPEVAGMGALWVTQYNRTGPEIPITVSDKESQTPESILLTTQRPVEGIDGQREILLGKRIMVPVISQNNPYFAQLMHQGVALNRFTNPAHQAELQWGHLLGGDQKTRITLYIQDDQAGNTAVFHFLNLEQGANSGIVSTDLKTILSGLQKDPAAIAFVNLSELIDPSTQAIPAGCAFLPIDKNSNGLLDYAEKIYANPEQLLRGIWIGKYPRTLIRNMYAITSPTPGEQETAVLNWMLTSGQQFLQNQGYMSLSKDETNAQLAVLTHKTLPAVTPEEATSQSGIAILILAGLCLGLIVVLYVIRKIRERGENTADYHQKETLVFNEQSLEIPKGLLYDKTHTWVFMEKDGNIRVGIDDFLQHLTGKLNRIQLKAPGEKVKKGELLLSLRQNGKLLNIFSPVSGIIREQNENLENQTYVVNSDPYGNGWMYSIEPSNWNSEVQLLDVAEKYSRWIKSEFNRFKDFIAGNSVASAPQACVVLQDGGQLQDGVLSEFGPETWEDFQTIFLNTHKQA